MKMHELAAQAKALGYWDDTALTPEEKKALFTQMHLNWDNFYQEIEMDFPLIQTQEDVSSVQDTVALHSHTYYEIIFVRSGSLQYLLSAQRYRVQRGDILLIRPGVSHRPLFLNQLQEKYSRVVIWISDACFRNLESQWPFFRELRNLPPVLRTSALSADATAYFESAFCRGVAECRSAEPGWEASLYANTLSILSAIYRSFCTGSVPSPTQEKQELQDEIMAYLENRLSQHISLEATARDFHVSESTISQLFRKRMGVSFYRYVTQRRLIAAKTLILQGVPMEQVAEDVGFSDYSGFFRAFKQEYGISPTNFRARNEQP